MSLAAFSMPSLANRLVMTPKAEGSLVERLAAGRPDDRERESQSDFAAAIARQGTLAGESLEHKTKRLAQDFVAAALVEPILKQLRETNHAAPPFAPTSGEKSFRQIADSQLSRQLVRKADWPVVKTLAQNLLDKAQGRTSPRPMPRYGPYLDQLRPPTSSKPTTHDTSTDTTRQSGQQPTRLDAVG